MMDNANQRLSKDVRKLTCCRNRKQIDETFSKLSANEVAIHFGMYRSLMEDRIFGNMNSSSVVAINRYRQIKCDAKIRK